jgi:hypothetical protein
MDDWQSDIETPLKAIERIAQSGDRLLAIQFFLFFSRFEYALKRLPKILEKGSGVQPDWDGYAKDREYNTAWLQANNNQEFKEALLYLDAKPPKKQVFSDGELKWVAKSQESAPQSLSRALSYVRRVRNNLFHGSKFDRFTDSSRDRELLTHCITILLVCVDCDKELREHFLEGLD